MSTFKYLDTLRLSSDESSYLLDKLDADEMSRAVSEASSGPVARVRKSVPLRVSFHEGQVQGYRVLTRAIRPECIDVLHGGYLHVGLSASMTLTTEEGEQLELQCEVQACEHVTGKVHTIRLALASHLDSTLLGLFGQSERGGEGGELQSLGGKLLHVEDSELDAKLLRQTLRDTSVQVVDSEHGFGAIAAIEREPFDAVLCDLTLPDMSGESLIMALREHSYQGPIAIVTGIRDRGRLQGALSKGACDIVLKPYKAERLHRTLMRVLPRVEVKEPVAVQASQAPASVGVMQILARDMASLPAAVASREFDVVRFRLARIHGSARNARVRPLEIAADRALRALDRGGSIKYAAREIQGVITEWESQTVRHAA
ncbi:MAG: response regulator [Phycisphaerales bacterium JB043]